MKLRGIEFGCVFTSSGARSFFGEGYWYHRLPIVRDWLDFSRTTLITKTTTLLPRAGNMPLDKDFQPLEVKPRCIIVKPWEAAVLNSVGLSGPGISALLDKGEWQVWPEPFFISFMSVEPQVEQRLHELQVFVDILKEELPNFRSPVGLEINFSCPNVDVSHGDLVDEVLRALEIASQLDVPLIPNFSALVAIDTVRAVAEHEACDAVSVANSIPWGRVPQHIKWRKLFGTDESPLKHLGGGGLSGAPVMPLTLDWLMRLRTSLKGYHFPKPLIMGGGIVSEGGAQGVLNAGFPMVQAIKLGCAPIVRPMNVQPIITAAYGHFRRPFTSQAPPPSH